jgi:hypothetical protein
VAVAATGLVVFPDPAQARYAHRCRPEHTRAHAGCAGPGRNGHYH